MRALFPFLLLATGSLPPVAEARRSVPVQTEEPHGWITWRAPSSLRSCWDHGTELFTVHSRGDAGACPPRSPDIATDAKPGQWVLALVTSETLDRPMVGRYRMVDPQVPASRVEDQAGRRIMVRNELIITLSDSPTLRTGDRVLGYRVDPEDDYVGVFRGIVLDGKKDGLPLVVRLRGLGEGGRFREPLVLEPGSYRKISGPLEPGASIAVRQGDSWHDAWVLRRQRGVVIALGFGDRVQIVPEAACVAMPLRPAVRPGDRVWVPIVNELRSGRVTQLSEALGHVEVEFEFSTAQRDWFGLGSFLTRDPRHVTRPASRSGASAGQPRDRD